MRFLASLLIGAALLGSVAWCQFHLTRDVTFDVTREAHGHAEEVAEDGDHTYRLEVQFSFAAERDPFALQTTQDADAARLSVQHAGRTLLERTDDIPRGESIQVADLAFAGDEVNLFIQATPSVEAARHPCALRVRLYRDDGALCDEATLWSDGSGAHVSGAVSLDLDPRLATLDRGLGGDE